MVLRWLDAVLADLRAIKAYIAEENPEAARLVIASIRSETGILINQPTIGRAGRIADTRELVIGQYPYSISRSIVKYRRVHSMHHCHWCMECTLQNYCCFEREMELHRGLPGAEW